jgi:hypothetical protein
MTKRNKKSNRGGARPGAGRPQGRTKIKVSVSVNETVVNRACERWGDKLSRLVEKLLDLYASDNVALEAQHP